MPNDPVKYKAVTDAVLIYVGRSRLEHKQLSACFAAAELYGISGLKRRWVLMRSTKRELS